MRGHFDFMLFIAEKPFWDVPLFEYFSVGL